MFRGRLTIRAKVLGGYSVLIVLFMTIVLNIFLTQQRISKRLKAINEDWLPMTSMVAGLANYGHLDESFDASKIEEARTNSVLLLSYSAYHPRLFENQLKKISGSVKESIQRVSSGYQKRTLSLIWESVEEVGKKHSEYAGLISQGARAKRFPSGKGFADYNELLLKKKSDLKSEISLLRRRLDNGIRAGLSDISKLEKKASIITSVLSLLAILIAGFISLFAIYTLAPIRKLTEGVKKISSGDYSFRFDMESGGEMRTLADEFNKMSQSITERNLALAAQQKKLIQSERMATVGRMASHITHEIKNPLNSMSLNSELLEDEIRVNMDGQRSGEAANLLKSIRKEIDRLSMILEEYLSYARIPKPHRIRVNPESILADLAGLLKPELDRKGIALSTDFRGAGGEIEADPNQLKQAFLNILKNSMEAIEEKGEIRISTEASAGGADFRITIEDTGKGIEKEIIDRIFDPFFSTKAKGTGLGLPLTHKIITEQSGEIRVKSEPGRWTRFEITLPLKGESRTTHPSDEASTHV